MAGTNRRENVAIGDELLGQARLRYPPGGSVDGTPSFELFESGPLAAAAEYFSRQYENAPEAAAGVRFYVTVGTFFPVMAFYAARVADAIAIISFTVEDNYWEMIEGDPE